MPPKSKAQARAMYAAREGKSTVGIPKKVGEEFTKGDPGYKNLPEKVTHKSGSRGSKK